MKDNWTEILDDGGCVDVAYCDFMKAFDKVCHKKLVHKLKLYNKGSVFAKWIESFLDGRTQYNSNFMNKISAPVKYLSG